MPGRIWRITKFRITLILNSRIQPRAFLPKLLINGFDYNILRRSCRIAALLESKAWSVPLHGCARQAFALQNPRKMLKKY